jgi:Potato inhibitor I family
MKVSNRKHHYLLYLLVVLFLLVVAASGAFNNESSKLSQSSASSNMTPDVPSSFPELVGLTGEQAKADLTAKYPALKVYVLREGSIVTMDYRMDRVRIFVDEDGVVSRPPKLG